MQNTSQSIKPKKIVITGGPGTGKSALINALQLKGFKCYAEVAREITLKAREQGVNQLFLKDPLLFSKKVMALRTEQYLSAEKENVPTVFFDRGLPDVLAYLDFKKTKYPKEFVDNCKTYTYDMGFILLPWQKIYKNDTERYENFEESKNIHLFLESTYSKFNYNLIKMPFDTVNNRVNFILQTIKNHKCIHCKY